MMEAISKERMPDFIKKAAGQIQKKLTIWEGEARNIITNTYTKIKEYPSLKKVGATVGQCQEKYKDRLDLETIRQRLQKLRTEMANRTSAVIELATKADIHTITSKINKLRVGVRDLLGRGKKITTDSANV